MRKDMDMNVEKATIVKRKIPKLKDNWPIQEETIGIVEGREKIPINEMGLELWKGNGIPIKPNNDLMKDQIDSISSSTQERVTT